VQLEFELVHTDLCGPMESNSMGESKYFMLFIDDFSKMTWVFFITYKSEAFKMFKKFKVMTKTQTGMKLKASRSDWGGEYQSTKFKQFCDQEGISQQLTTPYTPKQNNVAERKNRTIVELARSMLQSKGRMGFEEADPECFEEAAGKEEWVTSMKEKI
jgi:transposase InsO family protein